jgi:hypothetical protein
VLVVKRIYYINIVIFIVQNACNRSISGADPDTFKTGGEGRGAQLWSRNDERSAIEM